MKKIASSFLIFLLFSTFSCKKEQYIVEEGQAQLQNSHSKKMKSNCCNGVKCNTTYGILEFDSYEDFHNTINELIRKESSEKLNGGDKEYVINTINSSLTPAEIRNILVDYSPLSDDVLSLLLSSKLPEGIIQDVFLKNISFTEETINAIKDSRLTRGVKDIIIKASNEDIIIEDKILDDFEQSLGFTSLRKKIEKEEEAFLKNGGDPEINNPDDFFIQDIYLRAMLNPLLEVKIGNNIIKYLSPTIGSSINDGNYSTLLELRQNNEIERKNIVREFLKKDVILKTSACNADFTFNQTGNLTISFTNNSTGPAPLKYFWTFGDGYTSTAASPTHVYSYPSSFGITLQVTDGLGAVCFKNLTINVEGCNVNWGYTTTATGYTSFSSGQYGIANPYYKWDFGDGFVSYDVANPTHTYKYSGAYYVCLTMSTQSLQPGFYVGIPDCEVSYCNTVTTNVTASSCCDKNDKDKEKWKGYITKRKMVSKVHQTSSSVLKIFNYGAKTKNYKKNSVGLWVQEKVGEIHARIFGLFYTEDPSDGTNCAVSNVTDIIDTRSNDNAANASYWPQSVFWTRKNSLQSRHYIIYNGTRYDEEPLYLTTDC